MVLALVILVVVLTTGVPSIQAEHHNTTDHVACFTLQHEYDIDGHEQVIAHSSTACVAAPATSNIPILPLLEQSWQLGGCGVAGISLQGLSPTLGTAPRLQSVHLVRPDDDDAQATGTDIDIVQVRRSECVPSNLNTCLLTHKSHLLPCFAAPRSPLQRS